MLLEDIQCTLNVNQRVPREAAGHPSCSASRPPQAKWLSRSFEGSFNVRPGRELHRRAMLFARSWGLNLNTVVSDALRAYLERKEPMA
jgi:hypothetical protein